MSATKQDDTSALQIAPADADGGPVNKTDDAGSSSETASTENTTSDIPANAQSVTVASNSAVDAVETATGQIMESEPDAQSTSNQSTGTTATDNGASTPATDSGDTVTADTNASGSETTTATATADAATAAPAPSNSGTVNSLDTVVDDMALMNDLPLVGVNPAYGFSRGPGYNIMGNNPSGSNLPSWFTDSYPETAQSGY
jgi:hypothetical protein